MYYLGPDKTPYISWKQTYISLNFGFLGEHSDDSQMGIHSVGDHTNVIFSPIPCYTVSGQLKYLPLGFFLRSQFLHRFLSHMLT